MFLIFFVENWILRGLNSDVTEFHTRLTHLSIGIYLKNSLEKTVLKMRSQIYVRIALLVHKITWKKVQQSKNT